MSSTVATSWEESAPAYRGEGSAAPASLAPRSVLLFYLTISLLLGVLNQFTVRLVGLMPVDEILLTAVLAHAVLWVAVFHKLPAPLPAPRIFCVLLICQILALMSYVVADLWRGSFPEDMIRGWSRMFFLMINIAAFSLLFGASGRCFIAVQVGSVFSFIEPLLHGPLFGDYWKFGFAFPLTLLVLLAAPRFLGRWAAVGACLALGVIHAVMDFRSLGGICLVVALFLAMRLFHPALRKAALIAGALMTICWLPWGIQRAFSDAGARATRSNVERSAMLQAAWEAFVKRPLIGNGSWFSNSDVMDQFLLIRTQNARLAGAGGFAEDDAEGMAIHSQLLVALAEGGLFGATFFFAYGALLLWGMWFCILQAPWDWILPVRLFVLLISFWNLLMSPFSGIHRVEIAMACALLLLLWNERAQLRLAAYASR
jgi:hypothetical protein